MRIFFVLSLVFVVVVVLCFVCCISCFLFLIQDRLDRDVKKNEQHLQRKSIPEKSFRLEKCWRKYLIKTY